MGGDKISRYILKKKNPLTPDGVGAPYRGPLFYVPVVLADLYLPWSLLLPATLALVPWPRLWRQRIRVAPWREHQAVTAASQQDLRLLLGLWIVLIVGFFSLSKGQQDLYVLPFVAAAAPLAGGLVARVDGAAREAGGLLRATRWSLGAVGVVLAALCVFAAWFLGGTVEPIHLAGARLAGVLAAAGSVASLVLLRRYSPAMAVAALSATIIVVQWIVVLQVLPDFERYKPVPPLARVVARTVSPETPVATYRLAVPSLVYYLRRHVTQLFDEKQLKAFISDHPGAYWLMTDEEYEAVRDRLGIPLVIVARSPRFDAQLRDFLDREPVRDMLLVTSGS
jgi:4-amino-4-deoxy-L-arabinose transferase-like glycosyltransferase